ncbi:hypothetical protein [Collimonas pratensis]|uniref:hypothetical protein n=1 Tax=Collimonas pratensis TaxID=279113 RepID=UPI00142FD390|nr:hypothetical protein [Collimonas pratensis]
MKEKLPKAQLLRLLEKLMQPQAMTEKESDDVLLAFCAGCPDPVKARWLIVDCIEPLSNLELVERALSMPLLSLCLQN